MHNNALLGDVECEHYIVHDILPVACDGVCNNTHRHWVSVIPCAVRSYIKSHVFTCCRCSPIMLSLVTPSGRAASMVSVSWRMDTEQLFQSLLNDSSGSVDAPDSVG